MTFVPRDRLLWDFWFAPRRSGEPYHLFYLQAPRDLTDANLRHGQATVGHAISRDLVTWEERPTALTAGPAGSWDDRAIWTGSITERGGVFYWFYTALTQRDRVQRIGLAISIDPELERWERHPANPLLEADGRWYEKHEPAVGEAEAFRDPWVVYDPAAGSDSYLMFYTARAAERPWEEPGGAEAVSAGTPERPIVPSDGRGVIGLARSRDPIAWEALPPVTEAGEFGDLEVPQALELDGRWYLLFCTAKHAAARKRRCGPGYDWFGTHYLVADRLEGPYHPRCDDALVGDARGSYYAGRIVEDPNGRPVFLAWRQFDEAGGFLGGLSDPAPVRVLGDGRLEVEQGALWPE